MTAPVRFDIAAWHPPRHVSEGTSLQRAVRGLGQLLGRSLFPIIAVAVIAGTPLWGPWGTLILASGCFLLILRVA
jgi:hypothetical protein